MKFFFDDKAFKSELKKSLRHKMYDIEYAMNSYHELRKCLRDKEFMKNSDNRQIVTDSLKATESDIKYFFKELINEINEIDA